MAALLLTTSVESPQQEQTEKAQHHAQLEGVEEKGHNLFDHKHAAQGKEMTKNHKKTVAGDIPFISFAPRGRQKMRLQNYQAKWKEQQILNIPTFTFISKLFESHNTLKRVLYIKRGLFSYTNVSVDALLRREFPDSELEVIDIKEDLLDKRPAFDG